MGASSNHGTGSLRTREINKSHVMKFLVVTLICIALAASGLNRDGLIEQEDSVARLHDDLDSGSSASTSLEQETDTPSSTDLLEGLKKMEDQVDESVGRLHQTPEEHAADASNPTASKINELNAAIHKKSHEIAKINQETATVTKSNQEALALAEQLVQQDNDEEDNAAKEEHQHKEDNPAKGKENKITTQDPLARFNFPEETTSITEFVPDDALIVEDTGDSQTWAEAGASVYGVTSSVPMMLVQNKKSKSFTIASPGLPTVLYGHPKDAQKNGRRRYSLKWSSLYTDPDDHPEKVEHGRRRRYQLKWHKLSYPAPAPPVHSKAHTGNMRLNWDKTSKKTSNQGKLTAGPWPSLYTKPGKARVSKGDAKVYHSAGYKTPQGQWAKDAAAPYKHYHGYSDQLL